MQHSNASEGDRLPLHQGRDYQGVPYYDQTEHRYGSGYTEKPTQKKSRKKLCIIISVIILILAIVGGVVGGVSTDVLGNPLYPTATGSAVISAPTTINDSKWDCVRNAIPNNYYLSFWNDTIFQNATKFYDLSPTNYTIDGGLGGLHQDRGVLDVAREVQLRINIGPTLTAMTNDTKWVNRTWTEVLTAAGNSDHGPILWYHG
ncbi:BQ5605_C041g11991 [Microbotryum silenes-dioicae]|uniref:BQ5605_C041g11991 protein n=1 Tax=Microbotryum silenes-dioicae TaxID=796604 RepID=A0A2X0NCM3_9BASI|nr:BQ5605_C041g11991 [Microbotryum silenes-dioicae]